MDTESSFFIERLAQVEKVHAFGLSASLKVNYRDGFTRAGFRSLYPEELHILLPVGWIGLKPFLLSFFPSFLGGSKFEVFCNHNVLCD